MHLKNPTRRLLLEIRILQRYRKYLSINKEKHNLLFKVISSNNELLKRVLNERAIRVQDSSQDDDEEGWD
jgi:hypothetical protein